MQSCDGSHYWPSCTATNSRYYIPVTARIYFALVAVADAANRCPLLLSFADDVVELALAVLL